MQEIIAKYSLRITFKPNVEDPSRIFKSMASLIESFKSFDSLMAKSINSKIATKQVLEDIEKGSLVTRLIDVITIDNQEIAGASFTDENIANYVNGCRNSVIQQLSTEVKPYALVQDLRKNIESVAEQSGIQKAVTFSPPDPMLLARNVNDIAGSIQPLNEEEHVYYTDDTHNAEVKKREQIELTQIEEAITDKSISNTIHLFLLIRRPDFLGDTKWEFKHDKQTIYAKIADGTWLSSFKSGNVDLHPGDSIEVDLLEIAKYDKNGQVINKTSEVVKVHDIIHNTAPSAEEFL